MTSMVRITVVQVIPPCHLHVHTIHTHMHIPVPAINNTTLCVVHIQKSEDKTNVTQPNFIQYLNCHPRTQRPTESRVTTSSQYLFTLVLTHFHHKLSSTTPYLCPLCMFLPNVTKVEISQQALTQSREVSAIHSKQSQGEFKTGQGFFFVFFFFSHLNLFAELPYNYLTYNCWKTISDSTKTSCLFT